jgi:Domain of unknown function (DUF4375)
MNNKSAGDILYKHPKIKYMTLENIKSAADKDVDQQIMDCIEYRLSELSYDTNRLLNNLSPAAGYLYLTWLVEGEVNNGGFNQYFWNGYGDYANEAVKAFEYFGAVEHTKVMCLAIKIRNKENILMSFLKLLSILIGKIKAFSYSCQISKLDPIDDLFYELKEDLSSLRLQKIRHSPESFIIKK